jgi:hypothetical protein
VRQEFALLPRSEVQRRHQALRQALEEATLYGLRNRARLQERKADDDLLLHVSRFACAGLRVLSTPLHAFILSVSEGTGLRGAIPLV